MVAGGVLKPGDEVVVLPSGMTSKIAGIDLFDKEITEAFPPMSVTLRLRDDLDLSRGDMIVRTDNLPTVSQDLDLMLCWLHERPLDPRREYLIKHTSRIAKCQVKEILYTVDINTLHRNLGQKTVGVNDIARVRIRATVPLFSDAYEKNKDTGSVIIIDEGTGETVAGGMIR